MTAILIAEDEPRVSSFVRKGLSSNGYSVTLVTDGRSAYFSARNGGFDLMLLDTDLPGMDGFAVLRRLRADGSPLPVVMLMSRAGVADTTAALEEGADDYVVKPFRFEDLLARVRLRLTAGRAASTTLAYGSLLLDLRTRRAHVGDYAVDLSARECKLAETFLRHPGQVLSREQLLNQVWGRDHETGSNVVDVYVRYLRRKLGANRFATLRGMGYRLEPI
ncbi:response regulator transcription factor [Mycolicibacterium vanbaalenii]|uniref:Two component transcriptional regulator, winged helix family n=1 Tax=Mycolicibacterium vanbaalenii (strain DSM 7251 / JCM 13017 / BCRC 16820 / KCTC 9966 / NRRL B-24157 / PYR-1) TaxID=350058 RepID=A1T7Q3_MYCVP|nr:response regulator transcription factor [Mycolicibacterium vanbaalenii]ABM13203.1 two component transcriptional regulator, winged helix family [Mycolicibacterium vanbaalenii PYR-1]MCV7126848.1 response regulator transcription factor [Mycolicibacterium vanbaalenii PYR-1]